MDYKCLAFSVRIDSGDLEHRYVLFENQLLVTRHATLAVSETASSKDPAAQRILFISGKSMPISLDKLNDST